MQDRKIIQNQKHNSYKPQSTKKNTTNQRTRFFLQNTGNFNSIVFPLKEYAVNDIVIVRNQRIMFVQLASPCDNIFAHEKFLMYNILSVMFLYSNRRTAKKTNGKKQHLKKKSCYLQAFVP